MFDWQDRKIKTPPLPRMALRDRRLKLEALGLHQVGMRVVLGDGAHVDVEEIKDGRVRVTGSAAFISPDLIVRVLHH